MSATDENENTSATVETEIKSINSEIRKCLDKLNAKDDKTM